MDLKASTFLHDVGSNLSLQHFMVTKFFIRCHASLFFKDMDAAPLFGRTHPEDSLQIFCDQTDVVSHWPS